MQAGVEEASAGLLPTPVGWGGMLGPAAPRGPSWANFELPAPVLVSGTP